MTHKWKADQIPKYTLSMKYLKMILTPAELKALLGRYMEAKKKHLSRNVRKDSATDPEK